MIPSSHATKPQLNGLLLLMFPSISNENEKRPGRNLEEPQNNTRVCSNAPVLSTSKSEGCCQRSRCRLTCLHKTEACFFSRGPKDRARSEITFIGRTLQGTGYSTNTPSIVIKRSSCAVNARHLQQGHTSREVNIPAHFKF